MKYLKDEGDCDNDDDEIEGLNEKLLELLKTPQNSKCRNADYVRTLSGNYSDTDVDDPLDIHCCSASPASCHYNKCDYTFLNHGSPANLNALPHYLLPIGVFWDIENCPVPRGKSAAAVTQVIREKFFSGYREAEFIVVCDVYKENKQVIQELNDAQVNLIHVAATYKNAADEKLKQSIRRFSDIHGTPAAIILISSDINFAADMSDLRHRRKMHVILLHNENSSDALILCANEHYNFMELMESLPNRTATKASETYDLLISNLPKDKGLTSIKRRLKQLSDNCGGRVIGINSNAAIIRFALQESADRAQKRMDGEFVFDTKIIVRSVKDKKNPINEVKNTNSNTTVKLGSEVGLTANSPIQMYNTNSAFAGVRSLPGTPHCHSSSPVVGAFAGWNGIHCSSIPHSGVVPPTSSMFMGRQYPFNNSDLIYNRVGPEMSRQSPLVWSVSGGQQFGRYWEDAYKYDRSKNYRKRTQCPLVREGSTASSENCTPEGMRRIRGAHSSVNHPRDKINVSRQTFSASPMPNNYSVNNFISANAFRRRSTSPMYISQSRDAGQWSGQSQYLSYSGRNIKTPSPYLNTNPSVQINQQTGRCSPYQQNDVPNDEVEHFFNPISSRGCANAAGVSGGYMPIELQVMNLDQNIQPKEMKRILYSMFMEHVMLLHVSIFMQSDGNYAASVKVSSLQDAQYAISQLHRRKIGHKRILISYAHTGGPNPQLVRSQIVMLLQEVPGHRLPLFKFREMYESRFMISVSVSELYKMKDVCIITEDPGGRMVSLNPDHRNTPSPGFGSESQDGLLELPYCIVHTQKPWSDKGWAEQEVGLLPNVMMSLKVLGGRILQLLTTHNGSLPLPTLPNCYEAEFKVPLVINENGVPLEHLISCLASVELKQGVGSVKFLTWMSDTSRDEHHDESKCVSPALASQLALFSRELVDLLKTAPHCQIPFNRFIPAYHHHFGRQCRVADYGFTKLIDLLEALTNTVQVMGEGNNRVVTLSHRAQIRRFTSDLLRVLKAQASKQITLSEFPTVYTRVIGKSWDVVNYGVCEINDILSEVSENTVVVTNVNDDEKIIAIPKREQTEEEIERTKQFAVEVVELLRHAPQCTMQFNKFVPSYHHHFGHQCRVSDYGFTKLIELFEAIPHIIKIEDVPGGERRISLTEPESLGVLGEQISKLVVKSQNRIPLSNIAQSYLSEFGSMLRPESYSCNSIEQLIEKLYDSVKIVESSYGPVVTLIDKSHLQQLALRCRRILMDQSQQCLPTEEFKRIYHQYYGCHFDENIFKLELSNIIEFLIIKNIEYVKLADFQRLACDIYRVLMKYGGKINLQQFENAYINVIGSECNYLQYHCPTMLALLQTLSCTVVIKETRQKKKIIFLNKKLASVGIPLAPTVASPPRTRDLSDESFQSISSRTNVFNASNSDKWMEKSLSSQWNTEHAADIWNKKEHHWTALTDSENLESKWPVTDNNNEFHLKSLLHRSEQKEDTLPTKPFNSDFTDHEHNSSNENKWESSVWKTPPRYAAHMNSTNIDVPPIILPTWNQLEQNDDVSNLMSPIRNLLPAVANPLKLRTSPFFTMNNHVVAPHPSELPLPSLSLASKCSGIHKVEKKSEEKADSRLLGNSIEVHSPTNSDNYTLSESDISDILSTTPSKRLFGGKRRLAATFDQPIDS
ncbi:hypothetical protein PV326_000848 [Microctonus aethiopoides]|nr:hypothetical protein PV326_000848 [Microctonus aethiopoides]